MVPSAASDDESLRLGREGCVSARALRDALWLISVQSSKKNCTIRLIDGVA